MGRRPRTIVAPGISSRVPAMRPPHSMTSTHAAVHAAQQRVVQQRTHVHHHQPYRAVRTMRPGARLHIGCGSRRLSGWINADAVPGVGDTIIDLHNAAALPASTFSVIYGSHVLEHCWPQDTPAILRRMHDALLPGGTLRLSVPDLRLVVKHCLDSQVFGDENAALSTLYGGTFARTTTAPDLHRQAFWRERLEKLLKDAGFVNVREWGAGQYPEIDALKDWSTWPRDNAGRSAISLNLEADRPGTLQIPSVFSDAAAMRLLVRMPTRSRPKQALEVLSRYRGLAGTPITIEVVVDDNDASMATPDVKKRLAELECIVTSGSHKSKIEAVNGGRVNDWDVLLLASDDMVPLAQGYAVRVLSAMAEHFPYLDGAIYFNDNYVGQKLVTLPIMGRRLYDQFGYVYHPEYKSFFCDNEQTEVLQAINRLVYIDEKLIEHRHYANGAAKAPMDPLYKVNSKAWEHDEAIYNRRKGMKHPHAQIGFDSPPIWLSLLIATVPSRREMLEKLLAFLYTQAQAFPREVEIIVDPREQITIGAKRNAMLKRSVGRFVAHIDDDDWVDDRYVARVVNALKSMPDADCTDLHGIMTIDGKQPAPFKHSICYTGWKRATDGTWERTPEHRNAVRRDLALRVGFPDISFGEDKSFSDRLRPLIKKEVSAGSAPLYYYRYTGKPRSWYYGET